MRWLSAGIAAFAAMSLGCVGTTDQIGGKPREDEDLKVVSLSPSTTEIAARTSISQKIVGRTASCNFPPNIASIPIVMDGVSPDFERIAASGAKLAVYDKALFDEADMAKLKELGIEALGMDSSSLVGYEEFALRVAKRMGGETQISEYIDQIYARITENKVADGAPKPRIMFVMGSEGEYMVAGKNSLLGDITGRLNGDIHGPDGSLWQTMNVEAILAAQPQAIIAAGNAERILADPRLAGLPAVKTRLVVDVEPDVLMRAGQRMHHMSEAIGIILNRVKS
jgi:iron complex transport system substrate-binding protein